MRHGQPGVAKAWKPEGEPWELWVGSQAQVELECPCPDGLCGCEQNDPR